MTVRLVLGKFALSGLEAVPGIGVEAAAREALAGFAAKLRRGRRPLAPPGFLASPDAAAEIEIEIDAESEAALCAEAERRGIDVQTLGVHAVMLYLAELESVDDSLGRDGIAPSA